jgi:hypothetical protein
MPSCRGFRGWDQANRTVVPNLQVAHPIPCGWCLQQCFHWCLPQCLGTSSLRVPFSSRIITCERSDKTAVCFQLRYCLAMKQRGHGKAPSSPVAVNMHETTRVVHPGETYIEEPVPAYQQRSHSKQVEKDAKKGCKRVPNVLQVFLAELMWCCGVLLFQQPLQPLSLTEKSQSRCMRLCSGSRLTACHTNVRKHYAGENHKSRNPTAPLLTPDRTPLAAQHRLCLAGRPRGLTVP